MNLSDTFFGIGLGLGIMAGISPGPLNTLMISYTIQHGKKEGFLVALSPLITDLPIVTCAVLLSKLLTNHALLTHLIGLAGAIYLVFLAYETFFNAGKISPNKMSFSILLKGVLTNFLNPHPYIFWFTVGAPLLIKAYNDYKSASLLFIACFYMALVGSKCIITWLIDKSKSLLNSKYYSYILKVMAVILLIFAALFAKEGLNYFFTQ